MDIYHKVLLRIYEETGGKDSQIVDLRQVVKNEGFIGSYPEIFKFLTEQGWIVETPKTHFIRISHWGVKEAKKSPISASDTTKNLKNATNNLISITKELLIILDEFAADSSKENFIQVEKKFTEVNSAIAKLKENVQ